MVSDDAGEVTAMDRMTALDTWFLHVEDDINHMHIGSIGVFEGPVPDADDLQRVIGASLHRIPRYRQSYREVVGGLGRPVWVHDPHFDLAFHVRHTALPRPGDLQQLQVLVGRVMSQKLDRSRPLWETWFVEGVEGGRWAMISKVHHCVVDGIAGTDLLATVLQSRPDEPLPARDTLPPVDGELSRITVAREIVRAIAAGSADTVRAVAQRVRTPVTTAARAVTAVRGATELLEVLKPMPPSSLTGPIGPHRRYATARAPLADAKAVKQALGGTVNDVILAAIAGGFRALLEHRGELSADSTVRTMVPVSLRRQDQRGELHNLVAALFVPLPVTIADPAERYAVMRETMEEMKQSGEHATTAALVGASGLAPAMFVGLALRGATELLQRHQRYVTTVTTNVPGPQQPLYLLGCQLLEAYPYVPIAEGVRTGVAIFSYDEQLTFGVTGDYDQAPDVAVLAAGIEQGLAELVALVR
jgi:diacylglycerol O-acyltransferase / wax synthase